MDNESNKDYLNSEKGEFIVNKKVDEEGNEELNTKEEKGEFIVNKKSIEEENSNIQEDKFNNIEQNENINTSSNYEQNYNFNNQNHYNFEEEMQKIKDKNKKKNKKIIGFSIAGVLIIALIACFALFGNSGPSAEDYAYNGVEVNDYFEISPEDFAKTLDYINENIYYSDFDGVTIPTIGEITFNDEKGCYEKILDEESKLYINIYPTQDYDGIEKIIVSYDEFFTLTDSDKLDEINQIYSAYVNMSMNIFDGYNNFEQSKNKKIWDKLNSIKYKYNDEGIGYGKISYEDYKVTYTRNDLEDGTTSIIMEPNN